MTVPSDKLGTLVQLRDLTSKLDSTDFGHLLSRWSEILGSERMHQIVYSGLYKYYPLLQTQPIHDLMDVTLTHCKKKVNDRMDCNDTKDGIESIISGITRPIEKAMKSKLIHNTVPSLSTPTIEILMNNRGIKCTFTERSRSNLERVLSHNIATSSMERMRNYAMYSALNRVELLAEYELFGLKYADAGADADAQTDTELRCTLYESLNRGILATNLLDLHSAVICSICLYLDIKSLLSLEVTNRWICSEARRPSSCFAFDTSPCNSDLFAHYIASKYASFCRLGVVPDIHRFIHTQQWNITLSRSYKTYNKYSFDPTSHTGSRYTHCIMQSFMRTPFQKRLISLSVNLGHIQLDPHVPFPYHERLQRMHCIAIHPMDILRVLSNYPRHKFIHLIFQDMVLCDFQTASDETNYANFYRFLHFLLPKWNEYYANLAQLSYYPQLNLTGNLIQQPPEFMHLSLEGICDGELISKRPEFGREVAHIFNDEKVLKHCLCNTLNGYVCHTRCSDDILTYFTASILVHCGDTLQSLHFESDQFGFNLDYNQTIKLHALQELCLWFRDETLIPFIDCDCMMKLQRLFFHYTCNHLLLRDFIQNLMNNCNDLAFVRIHVENDNNLSVFQMIESVLSNRNANQKNLKKRKQFTLKISASIHSDYNNSTTGAIAFQQTIKLILNHLNVQYEESVVLIKLVFNGMRNDKLFKLFNITSHHKWKIYQECVHNKKTNTCACVKAFVSAPNCGINGYSAKWICNCKMCHDKLPWFCLPSN